MDPQQVTAAAAGDETCRVRIKYIRSMPNISIAGAEIREYLVSLVWPCFLTGESLAERSPNQAGPAERAHTQPKRKLDLFIIFSYKINSFLKIRPPSISLIQISSLQLLQCPIVMP